MQGKDLYAQILGVQSPWLVRAVDLDLPGGEVVVHVQHDRQVALCCSECGAEAPGYDSRERRWRHLDTCQYRTILAAAVSRHMGLTWDQLVGIMQRAVRRAACGGDRRRP